MNVNVLSDLSELNFGKIGEIQNNIEDPNFDIYQIQVIDYLNYTLLQSDFEKFQFII